MIVSWRSPFRFLRAMWDAIVAKIHGVPIMAPAEVQAERAAVCTFCEHNIDWQCRKCTCFIDVMIALSSKQCPLTPPKWERLTFLPKDRSE